VSGRNWPRLQRGHFLALGGHGTFALCNVKEGGIALCNEKASRPSRTQMLVPPFFWRGFFFGPFSTTAKPIPPPRIAFTRKGPPFAWTNQPSTIGSFVSSGWLFRPRGHFCSEKNRAKSWPSG